MNCPHHHRILAAEPRSFRDLPLPLAVMRHALQHARPKTLGEKCVNEPELWIQTENMVRDVLRSSGINYVEVPNEAAFYGPKI
jgi:threonyl-tRNA synthetase